MTALLWITLLNAGWHFVILSSSVASKYTVLKKCLPAYLRDIPEAQGILLKFLWALVCGCFSWTLRGTRASIESELPTLPGWLPMWRKSLRVLTVVVIPGLACLVSDSTETPRCKLGVGGGERRITISSWLVTFVYKKSLQYSACQPCDQKCKICFPAAKELLHHLLDLCCLYGNR